MKILHILNSFSLGGAEKVAISIINELSQEHDFGYLCLSGGNIKEYLNTKECDLFLVNKLTLFSIYKTIKVFNPDVIHAHDFTASVLCSLVTNKRIISHIHHNAQWMSNPNLKTILYRICSHRICKIIFVSNSAFEQYVFKKVIKDRTIVLPNIVDLKKLKEQAAEKCNCNLHYDILYVGRLEDAKNPLRFLDIVSMVVGEYEKPLKIGMIGQGSLYDKCKKKIMDNNLSMIKLLGFQKNPYKYMKNSRILLVTSRYEGFGLVAEEGYLLGMNVVSVVSGELKNIVTSNNGNIYLNNDEAKKIIIDILKNDISKDETIIMQKNSLSPKVYSKRINCIYWEGINKL